MIRPGIYTDLNMKDYHADPALTRSDIVRLNLSPMFFKEHVDEDKPAYRIGRALHGLVLQGIPLIVNEAGGRTKVGKAFQAENLDAVTPVMADMITNMAKKTEPFFREGQAEVSFFWEQMVGDAPVICKCRPDWLASGVIYDFKSTRQSLESFHWDVKSYRYDVQAAWYLKGIEQHIPVSTFRFVVVEKTPPHRVGIYEISDLTDANNLIDKSLETYRQCMLTDVWDEPDMEVHIL